MGLSQPTLTIEGMVGGYRSGRQDHPAKSHDCKTRHAPGAGHDAGHFGMGYGDGAHAPNEFYEIESRNSKIGGMATATRSFVDYLNALA